LNYKNDIIKYVYIFDYFYNEKREEIKIGFRFVFQAKKTTLTSNQIDEVYNDIINKSLKIEGLNIPGI
jgi:phenylalanyl-tRNA synthetase beta subunit